MNAGSTDRSMAITGATGGGLGGALPDASVRKDAVAETAAVATSGAGSALALACGIASTAGAAGGLGAVAAVASIVGPGFALGGRVSTALPAGFAAAAGPCRSTTRSSGASIQRSCQGSAKPGSPNSSPPKVRLSNDP